MSAANDPQIDAPEPADASERDRIRDRLAEDIERGKIRMATYPICIAYGLRSHRDIREVQAELAGMGLLISGREFAAAA